MVRRGLSVLAVIALGGLVGAAIAAAEPPPPFDGVMAFPDIQGADGPEEFSWVVTLGEEDELRAIDETHAGVYWEDTETLGMLISAGLAHAADGATVPTTLSVTQPDIVTLTVHHRAGNPAAGGAPFDYPVVTGAGWEGGFQQTVVVLPPTERTPSPPVLRCTVPALAGLTLRSAIRRLRRSNCGLGEVRGERSRGARVVRQFRRAGKSLPVGTRVDLKLLVP